MNYNHITINKRACIYQFKQMGLSLRKIAGALNRSPNIYVSGFIEDGKVIVSSWGNKYIFDEENSSWIYKLTLKYE